MTTHRLLTAAAQRAFVRRLHRAHVITQREAGELLDGGDGMQLRILLAMSTLERADPFAVSWMALRTELGLPRYSWWLMVCNLFRGELVV